MSVADLDGDGLLDIARGAEVRLADPAGGFRAPQIYWGVAWATRFHDLDGDGELDRIGISSDALQVSMHR